MSKLKEIKVKEPKFIDCSNCKFLCTANFSEEIRLEICKNFWQLGDYRRQKDFILMNVRSSLPKRRRPSKEASENSKIRTNSKSFFLLNRRVCQSFFLKTLSISNGPLIKAFKHKNVYTNFFDGDDKRGKHTPSNKLSQEIIDGVVQLLVTYTIKSTKGKKRVISDPDIKSLRQLYKIYKEGHPGGSPCYTSFKRIFNEHNFAFPPDRIVSMTKTVIEPSLEVKNEDLVVVEVQDETEDLIEEDETFPASDQILPEDVQPKVIVQVPDNTKFFANPSQVYEIQFIEIPVQSIIEDS